MEYPKSTTPEPELHPVDHIFLIDDDKIVNYINEKQFEYSHVCNHVEVYQHAIDALNELKDILAKHPKDLPQMIFLDVNMPGMDAWDFLNEMQRLPKPVQECQVFLLSASVDEEDVQKSKTYPVVKDYLSKPLNRQIIQRLFAA